MKKVILLICATLCFTILAGCQCEQPAPYKGQVTR